MSPSDSSNRFLTMVEVSLEWWFLSSSYTQPPQLFLPTGFFVIPLSETFQTWETIMPDSDMVFLSLEFMPSILVEISKYVRCQLISTLLVIPYGRLGNGCVYPSIEIGRYEGNHYLSYCSLCRCTMSFNKTIFYNSECSIVFLYSS